jgi:2,4-dienoyl-CoA reductase-like NADH-dependent reductase (Old Yellow Enzyme family)/thioredoxin reductase
MFTHSYPHLFTPLKVNDLTLKNRIMSAPNMQWQIIDGKPSDYYIGYLEHKARGGAAQVTLGECPICDGASHVQSMQMTENNMPIFSEVAAAIKEHGAIACVELTHSGCHCKQKYNKKQIMGPVATTNFSGEPVKQMTIEDMEDVANSWADAAEFMFKAGFDAVLVHAAHGWLFPQFLSPLMNTRTDEFGGSLENRMRFQLMCLKRMRERVGPRRVIEMRVSGSSRNEENDFTCEDVITFLEKAQEYIDFIEVSAENGLNFMASTYRPHLLQVDLSEKIKKSGRIHIPIFVIGSILSPEEAEEIIASGKADGVSLARALIADPYFPLKAQTGHADEITPCLRCLHCSDNDNLVRHFECSVNPLAGREARLGFQENIGKPNHLRKVLIVGGGIGGMEAAITAARRGHEVILCEKSDKLGGLLNFTDNDSLKHDLRRYKNFMVRRTGQVAVNIRLNTEVTEALVEEIKPDHIIVACGSTPTVPTFIKGYENAHHALDVYMSPEETIGSETFVIIGGGPTGIECGLHLANLGKKVTVLEVEEFVPIPPQQCYLNSMKSKTTELGVEVVYRAFVKEISAEGVIYEKDGKIELAKGDTFLYAVGMRRNDDLYMRLADKAPIIAMIGDCRSVGKVVGAVQSGFFAALDVGKF